MSVIILDRIGRCYECSKIHKVFNFLHVFCENDFWHHLDVNYTSASITQLALEEFLHNLTFCVTTPFKTYLLIIYIGFFKWHAERHAVSLKSAIYATN